MIRGCESDNSLMWKWLIFARKRLNELASANWPGCYFKVILPCPQTLGQATSRIIDHGSETNFASSSSNPEQPLHICTICGEVEARLRYPPLPDISLVDTNPGSYIYQEKSKINSVSTFFPQAGEIMFSLKLEK